MEMNSEQKKGKSVKSEDHCLLIGQCTYRDLRFQSGEDDDDDDLGFGAL
jgi:hypothetical protein